MSQLVPSAAGDLQRPTQIRWLVLAMATLSSVLLYLDRNCVAIAAESIRVDLRATQQDMGWFLGVFFWSYALAQVPAGRLSDRFGIRTVLTLYILAWSVFTALMGVATGLTTLLAYRLGCGLAQAGAYPSCARAVRDWMPLSQRGSASSLVALGGRIGGALAPVLTGFTMIWLATASHSPQLRPDEILDPKALAEFVARQQIEAPSLWGSALSSVPLEDGEPALWADFLNRQDVLDHLATYGGNLSEQLPAPALRHVQHYRRNIESVTSEDLALIVRRFWESMHPTAIRNLEVRGWRSTLMIYGFAGVGVAALFWLVFRNTPSQHPLCNAAEVRLIGAGSAPAATATAQAPFPWRAVLTNLPLWGSCIGQFATNFGWLFLVTGLPRYLDEVHHVPALERGWLASIPIFAGLLGMVAGGPWTDRSTARFGLKWGRRIPITLSRGTAIAGYILCILTTSGWLGAPGTPLSIWLTVAGCSIVAISTDLGVAATWAYMQDIGGRHTAAVLGWANMWGNLGAAVAPPLTSMFLGEHATPTDWNIQFGIYCGAFVVSALGGWLMDSSRPLEPEESVASDEEPA